MNRWLPHGALGDPCDTYSLLIVIINNLRVIWKYNIWAGLCNPAVIPGLAVINMTAARITLCAIRDLMLLDKLLFIIESVSNVLKQQKMCDV